MLNPYIYLTQEDVNKLLNSTSDEAKMKLAIKSNQFYVIATPCHNGHAIGSIDDKTPLLFATESEAASENENELKLCQQLIAEGQREEDDTWDGQVMKAEFSQVLKNHITLKHLDGSYCDTESIDNLCGF